jgi:hypothetical protein
MSHKASLACAGAFAAAAAFAGIGPALSHTIVGNRVFPATLTIDDPGVNDELALPAFAYSAATTPDGTLGPISYTFGWEYAKTITADLGFSIGSEGFTHQVNPSANGWANIETQLKYVLSQNPEHEFIIATAGSIEIGHTGDVGAGFADPFSSITAKAYVGKGFGDVEAEWARPFAVTGEMDYTWSTHPIDVTGVDQFGNVLIDQTPTVLTYGATLQYSLLYMNSYVHEVPEFFRNLISTVEAIFSTPVSNIGPSVIGALPGTHETTGVVGPAVYYFGRVGGAAFEIGVMAQVPVNAASGKHVGAVAVLDFFLDDMFPDSIGKPLFGPPQARGYKTSY